jgi:hypothetical protein
MVAAVDPGRETLFELHFNQSRIAYYLGSTQETLDYYGRAKKILDGILTFLPTPADRDRFLNQAIYRDFRAFVRDAGLKK